MPPVEAIAPGNGETGGNLQNKIGRGLHQGVFDPMSKCKRHCRAASGALIAVLLLASAAPLPEGRGVGPEGLEIAGPISAVSSEEVKSHSPRTSPSQDLVQEPSFQGNSDSRIDWGALPDWAIVAFTLVLTVVTVLQHRLDSKLAKEAGDTVQTAKDSAAATKLMAQVQMATMRAQMSPTEVQITQVSRAGDPAEAFLLRVNWRNSAATAAQNCIIRVAADFVSVDDPTPIFPVFPATAGAAVVHPNIPIHTNYIHLAPADLARAAQGEFRLIVWSRCDYNDVFEPARQRATEMCVEMGFMGNVADLLDPDENGGRYRFGWKPVGEQNYST